MWLCKGVAIAILFLAGRSTLRYPEHPATRCTPSSDLTRTSHRAQGRAGFAHWQFNLRKRSAPTSTRQRCVINASRLRAVPGTGQKLTHLGAPKKALDCPINKNASGNDEGSV